MPHAYHFTFVGPAPWYSHPTAAPTGAFAGLPPVHPWGGLPEESKLLITGGPRVAGGSHFQVGAGLSQVGTALRAKLRDTQVSVRGAGGHV